MGIPWRTIKEVQKRGDKARKDVEKITPRPPQEGLVPIGKTPFYVTPGDPADPRDCNRYPNSPWCGGNPFNTKPFDLGFEVVGDECNIGIQINPTFGFIRTPPVQILYRSPSCRPTPPPTGGNESSSGFGLPPDDYLNEEMVLVLITKGSSSRIDVWEDGQREIRRSFNIDSYDCPDIALNGFAFSPIQARQSYSDLVNGEGLPASNDQFNYPLVNNFFTVYIGDESYILEIANATSLEWNLLGYEHAYKGKYKVIKAWTEGTCLASYGDSDPQPITARKKTETVAYTHYEFPDISADPVLVTTRVTYEYGGYKVIKLSTCEEINPEPPNNNPPPPEPCRPCMNCCCNSSSDNDSDLLLRLLLQRVGVPTVASIFDTDITKEGAQNTTVKLDTLFNSLRTAISRTEVTSRVLGIDKFPGKLPKRLIYPKAKGEERVECIADILKYQVNQVDRAVGFLPQKIKILDADPAIKGSQKVEVEVHSFADFAKEILQYIIDIEGDGDATNNMLVRCLYELGFIHQGVVQGDAMLDAVVDHLDFKHKWKKVKIPFAFDPYAGQKGKVGQGFEQQKNNQGIDSNKEEDVEKLLPALLKNTEVEVRVIENIDKKSLNDALLDIKRDTALAAGAVSEPANAETLEKLVLASQQILQLQGAIQRRNTREAMTSGLATTRKKKKE